ncbi:MAG TPA: hypothetical protein VMI06_08850 [Terriglobia bacterium]|nr:hypothetical protein [Terriglobia bacterium]
MVIGRVDPGAVMAAGYAVFLGLAALALELLARQSHRRAEQFHVFGFHYDPALDAWHCPTGKRLHRAEIHRDRRAIVYRAPAHHCNRCPVKVKCTDSDNGRSIERRLDSWLDSEIRRFHIGLSLALLVLAASILVIELTVRRHGSDRLVLSAALAVLAVPGARIGLPFFSGPRRARNETSSAEPS